MGQPVLAVLDVARTIRNSLDGRNAFRPFAYIGLRRRLGSVLDFLHSARAIDHQMQRPKVKASSRRRQGSEKRGVAVDLLVGDSIGLRAPMDCNRPIRCECNDVVYTRSPH